MGEKDRAGLTVDRVEFATHLVGKGVDQTKEAIGEGHTGDRGGVMHLFAGFEVVLTIFDRAGQIGEDELNRF